MHYIDTTTLEYPFTIAEIIARHPALSFPNPFTPPDGYAEVTPSAPPTLDADTQRAVEAQPVLDAATGAWAQAWAVQELTGDEQAAALAAGKQDLKERATAARWACETGGITLPDGTRIATAKDDQDRITSVVANAGLAGVTSVDFKAEAGWVTLSIEQINGIAAAVALHVQACFSAERAHHEAIEQLATPAAVRGYDVTVGWPSAAGGAL